MRHNCLDSADPHQVPLSVLTIAVLVSAVCSCRLHSIRIISFRPGGGRRRRGTFLRRVRYPSAPAWSPSLKLAEEICEPLT